MSKIYEALLQAELDRLREEPENARGELAQPLSHEELSAAPADQPAVPAPKPEAAPLPIAAPQPVLSAAAAASVPAPRPAPKVQTPLPPGHIQSTRQVWHPNFSKLPATLQRGSQVEQFRSLRSKLFEFRDHGNLKTILVSSGRPAEGKSFVAANLAIMLARHKSTQVLLIDGDMRRSSQHILLGCPHEPGLAEYLSGKATLAEILQSGRLEDPEKTMPAGLAHLSFIGAGNAGDKAADLSGSPRFQALMDQLGKQFDWIIVDSSPVNLVTDGVNLARACNGVLLVARGGVTRYETAQKALTELKATKILGIILNAVQDAPPADGYYGYDTYDSVKQE